MEFIDLQAQQEKISKSLHSRINAVLAHGKFIMGPEVAELEERLSKFVGSKHCVTVANGTDALQIAMMALDIRPGDEVITTPFSFIATVETILLLGAKPVFVDIEPDTYNLNPSLLEEAINPKTKAIIAVSLYGQCADFDKINAIAEKHKIPVIEDGAQSFGATYHGKRSCGLSLIGCTSFFPSKPLGCYGDGGACFTNDDLIAKAMREIRLHGQDRRYHHPILGVNSRLDTLQAAILLAKLEVFSDETLGRSQVAMKYSEKLSSLVGTPRIRPENISVYAQYTIELEDRAKLETALKEAQIPFAVHYPIPLHLQPVVKNIYPALKSFPVAERAAQRVLSLPMHPYLSESDQRRVVEAVLAVAN